LELANQVKLLRFLDDRRVLAVGGRTARVVDVRVVAATNRVLPRLVRAGTFREDLLHRFAAHLVVPPLRERRAEILAHAELWIDGKASEYGVAPPSLEPDARALLLTYRWPGNVRQLRMVLAQAVLLAAGGVIDEALLR